MDPAELLLDKGLEHHQAGRLDEAERLYRDALRVNPVHPDGLHLLGLVQHQQGQHEAAIDNICRAVGLKPGSAVFWANLSAVYRALKRQAEAVDAAEHAIRLHADYAEAHNNLGVALLALGRLDEAVASLQQALHLRPDYARAHNNLGAALREQGKLDDAVRSFQKAVDIFPDYAEAHSNLGVALREQGKLDEAACSLLKALEINPDDADAHKNLGFLLLRLGDFEEGWAHYEWRWQTRGFKRRSFTTPPWDGQPLDGKSVLLYAEQGLGDTIQFIRYAPLVRQHGCRVIVECQKPLRKLLSSCHDIDQLMTQEEELPAFDFHVPFLSLPRLLGTRATNIPGDVPYLFAREDLVRYWRDRLSDTNAFKVGICWQGSPTYDGDRRRSVALTHFSALAEVPGVQLISLQKGVGTEQLTGVHFSVQTLTPDFDETNGAFMDTAAVMRNLDLVVASDTALVHLAGALAVPIWVALAKVSDWRWLLDREDTPWYPTMRLFRQSERDNWQQVFECMAGELKKLISQLPHVPYPAT
jgi:tetratricopeptide (TPR) repeat protein